MTGYFDAGKPMTSSRLQVPGTGTRARAALLVHLVAQLLILTSRVTATDGYHACRKGEACCVINFIYPRVGIDGPVLELSGSSSNKLKNGRPGADAPPRHISTGTGCSILSSGWSSHATASAGAPDLSTSAHAVSYCSKATAPSRSSAQSTVSQGPSLSAAPPPIAFSPLPRQLPCDPWAPRASQRVRAIASAATLGRR